MIEIVPAATRTMIAGRLALLACPAALSPHAEFAVASVLATPVSLQWSPQPARPGQLCAALEWRAPASAAGRLTSRLAALGPLLFEVTEGASPGCDPMRYAYVPSLGLHRGTLAASGDVAVGEGPLRELLELSGSGPGLAGGLRRLLGTDWDEALEPLRDGGYAAPVTWLRQTG